MPGSYHTQQTGVFFGLSPVREPQAPCCQQEAFGLESRLTHTHTDTPLSGEKETVRAGSVAVAGHALDCAECAGMRRMRWKCTGMRWNAPFAPNCAKCAELRRLRRIAPFARCLRRIALEFCLQPGTQPYTHGWRSLVATSLLAACSFRAVPVVPGFCGSLLHQFPHSCDFSSTVSHAEGQTMPVKN